jgi:hypothetical protein
LHLKQRVPGSSPSNSRSRTWRWEAARSGEIDAVKRGKKGSGPQSIL